MPSESLAKKEEELLNNYFTNTDRAVFALKNLPEVVKGALFARYSRTHKPLRQIFLDEYTKEANDVTHSATKSITGWAEGLYDRVFSDYGDDSVAQLGAAHIACEGISNIATKALERGRLASYLEQSTRYIRFDKKTKDGNYLYVTPKEVKKSSLLSEYKSTLDMLFETYSVVVGKASEYYLNKSNTKNVSKTALNSSVRAAACDIARGLLPAATASNVGVFASGQAFERMMLRLNSHNLLEVKTLGESMLKELREVIPSFLKRVDVYDRGVKWSNYLKKTKEDTHNLAGELVVNKRSKEDKNDEVMLVEYEKEGEKSIAAAILYEMCGESYENSKKLSLELPSEDIKNLLSTYAGERSNRRHMPGRAFESTYYRFDILSDFGSFRDLQRHRILTFEWQPLTTKYGYTTPPVIEEIGLKKLWENALNEASLFWGKMGSELGEEVAQYAVPFAYKLRYNLKLNARQAFHLIELRTSEQAHEDYRRICLDMHRLIRDEAGHKTLAGLFKFIPTTNKKGELARLAAESLKQNKGRQIELKL